MPLAERLRRHKLRPSLKGYQMHDRLFALTLMLSAALLFGIQPLFARLALPHLGGAAAVWTTAMLFFQAVLLLGYLWAHWLSRWPIQVQWGAHLTLCALGLLALPIALPPTLSPPAADGQVIWLLGLMAGSVGLPFLALSANAPLVQGWYAARFARAPWHLYAASNLGSILSLLAFPLVLSPWLGVTRIAQWWGWGYGLLLILLAVLGWLSRRASLPARPHGHWPPVQRSGRWVVLAMVPTSFMLAVTSFIAADIGSAPLVWVLPLTLYLLTFVIAFGRTPPRASTILRWQPLLLASVMIGVVTGGLVALSFLGAGLALLCFFVCALGCHLLLNESRPTEGQLTAFYFALSLGGVLGGFFNSVVAPLIFESVLEFPLVLAATALLMPGIWRGRDLLLAALATLAGIAALHLVPGTYLVWLGVGLLALFAVVIVGQRDRPLLMAGLLAGCWALITFAPHPQSVLWQERSFFGVHRIMQDDRLGAKLLMHGATIHGVQLETAPRLPTNYYAPAGGFGQVLDSPVMSDRRRVGVVGLGAGTLACYALPAQTWHFFEIDPTVVHLAQDHFTFLRHCAPKAQIHLGDGRRLLANWDGEPFDVLVLDAFSSDAIPTHLLTREAMALYRDRLTPDGIVLIHISNRYFDLEPPLTSAAQAEGFLVRKLLHMNPAADGLIESSMAMLMLARTAEPLLYFGGRDGWREARPATGPVWSDDHHDLMRWMLRPAFLP